MSIEFRLNACGVDDEDDKFTIVRVPILRAGFYTWTRNQGNTSTYDYQYSSKQYDRRRKYEVLQYKKNKHVLTRNQSFSQMVNKSSSLQNIQCTNSTIKVSTSASNVPGKKELLYLEEEVPLTRYKRGTFPKVSGGKWPMFSGIK